MPEGPCRVLEMLIGLAYRLEFEMLGGRFERPASAWFWVLIDNLGLKWCDNEAYLKDITVDQVDVIVLNMLERRYNEDGNGGLFPLIDPQKRPAKSRNMVPNECLGHRKTTLFSIKSCATFCATVPLLKMTLGV